MSDTELGARLKSAREKNNLTQKEVTAKTSIVKEQTLSAYERGVNSPPIEILKELATLYNISTDYLLFGQSFESRNQKTDKDYLMQLVEAVDNLELKLLLQKNNTLFGDHYHISLIPDNYSPDDWEASVYPTFVDNWAKLRTLKTSGAIDYSDYLYLMKKKMDQLPDDINLTISFTLPFDDESSSDSEHLQWYV